ncbi:MarR family transcriptional regulator, organic hydroperoxide resistance regulator [Cytobacillus horneckiae]|uniref:HTH-type transcriptional regulator SarZ n=1 Tax=Cytobacillus horneckiae TaxID=549687 RepID=A0A2N0ZEN6_9BACI|nr:MarR family transcriptional regulator [Cytobacillus horneckiae]MBN6888048.1 MarR family transcriptional regulator [Cytobacillus horneckiae]MCM3176904.1 MarR family transcriptional regulator [Cytobacillus horneckiae]MEC1158419.1 MarR family transcriptional regulator [Cytobacillus horneckiae]MED2937550.1 MarR family transcriptional regulator [Cytobacillus horneckiae]PKG27975.1 MarR family transcriptional regulator [Cytobacillus horneckiae]
MKYNTVLLNQYWTDIYFHLRYNHHDKISHQAVRILQLIEKRDSIGVGEVAENLEVSHNTASEHIKRLIEKGWVLKERSSHDERKVHLRLTKEGEKVLHRNSSLDEVKLKQILESLPIEDAENIFQSLQLLSECARR